MNVKKGKIVGTKEAVVKILISHVFFFFYKLNCLNSARFIHYCPGRLVILKGLALGSEFWAGTWVGVE